MDTQSWQSGEVLLARQLCGHFTQRLHLRRRRKTFQCKTFVNSLLEWIRLTLLLSHRDHRRAEKKLIRDRLVELVLADAHDAADDSTRWKVQLRHLSADLDTLLVRKPVAPLPKRVVERHVYVVESPVHIGRGCKRKRHSHNGCGGAIDEKGADNRGAIHIPRP